MEQNYYNKANTISKNFGDYDYYGQVNLDLPHDKGTCAYVNSNLTFTGDWNLGTPMLGVYFDGKRRVTIKSKETPYLAAEVAEYGFQYFGAITPARQRSGFGTCYYKNGSTYKGQWAFDKYHGYGILISQNTKYEGEFKNGVRDGTGVEAYDKNGRYEGNFAFDKPYGEGKYTIGKSWLSGRWFGLEYFEGVIKYNDIVEQVAFDHDELRDKINELNSDSVN